MLYWSRQSHQTPFTESFILSPRTHLQNSQNQQSSIQFLVKINPWSWWMWKDSGSARCFPSLPPWWRPLWRRPPWRRPLWRRPLWRRPLWRRPPWRRPLSDGNLSDGGLSDGDLPDGGLSLAALLTSSCPTRCIMDSFPPEQSQTVRLWFRWFGSVVCWATFRRIVSVNAVWWLQTDDTTQHNLHLTIREWKSYLKDKRSN